MIFHSQKRNIFFIVYSSLFDTRRIAFRSCAKRGWMWKDRRYCLLLAELFPDNINERYATHARERKGQRGIVARK